jgi:putative heme-binding domain-containing protein
VGKPEAHGTIYRVRRTGGHRITDPRGLTLEWASATHSQLATRLADPRFAVRDRTVATLARSGDAAVPALTQAIGSGDRQARLQAVWALTRIDTPAAQAVVRRALADADAGVRQAAARSVFTTRDPGAAAGLRRLLADPHPTVRREAAAALGRLDASDAVAALLEALTAPDLDRTLEHALIYALIEIDEPAATAAGLHRPQPAVRRGALLALDQMPESALRPEQVLPLLDAADALLRNAALMVVARRQLWSAAVAADLRQRVAGGSLSTDQAGVVRELVMRFGRDAAVQELIGQTLARPGLPPGLPQLLLSAVADTSGVQMHPSWVAPLTAALRSNDVDLMSTAIRIVRAARAAGFDEALQAIGADPARDPLLRISALQAIRGSAAEAAGRGRAGAGASAMDAASFDLALGLLRASSVPVRVQAAEMLARASLTSPQLLQLAGVIETAGPMEVRALTPALGRSREAPIGLALLEALGKSPGLPGLTEGDIRRSFRSYPEEVVTASGRLVQQLLDRDRDKDARLTALASVLDAGEASRGRQVFAAGKGSCLLCHRIGGTGGEVGPDLSTIGRIRSGQELLAAIAYPLDNIARGYETYTITMNDGRSLVGTVQRETTEAVYLTPASGPATPLARDQMRSMAPSPISLMPPGLDALLTRQELGDLIAYLRSLK